MAKTIEVIGSSVRDYCMLERNFLAHIKLVLLLSLLSSSALLGIRLPGPPGSGADSSESLGKASLPVATLQFIAALATVGAAYWEYHTGCKDLMKARAFFAITKVHLAIMSVVSAIIIATSIVYLVNSG
ncbi:hypothetical protein BV22DRAFT_1007231 [Leucogyrophana mollusca]|uniref:Uncharacterized protein n=1 Tax=Leucogyrophana mollusca TaxID=85980 RepID=A0ACB8BN11_9AGAM|nr:hypothetical protein BV22DRAFT_1007231 [Leucogyrophana mollusca]